jgi:hypothetical protein
MIIVLIIMIGATTFMWLNSTEDGPLSNRVELYSFIIIGKLLIMAGVLAVRRISSHRRGEPDEDELSKKILQRAAAI